MRKDLLGDILGEGGDIEVDPENDEPTEAVSIESDEMEPYDAPLQPESDVEAFAATRRRKAPRVEIPAEVRPSSSAQDSVLYVQARRVAELKFTFYKWVALLIPINVLFFCMARFAIGPSGRYWFLWPLGVSGVLLIFQYFRAFLLKGRSLHGMVEGTIHDMAMRESRKKKYRDFL